MSQTSKSSKKIPTSDTKSSQGSAPDPKADSRLNKRLKDMPIAIVGMASIFANSRYLNKFWDLISEKIDAITELPSTHWQPEDYFDANKSIPDKSYCKRGGFYRMSTSTQWNLVYHQTFLSSLIPHSFCL